MTSRSIERRLACLEKKLDTVAEPVTINGHDIEKMSREELIAAIRAMAPMVAELQEAGELLLQERNLWSLADAVGASVSA